MAQDIAVELRNFANGCRGSMWQSRDETIRLMDNAAAEIEVLRSIVAKYGDRSRMAFAADMRCQQAIDRAFQQCDKPDDK